MSVSENNKIEMNIFLENGSVHSSFTIIPNENIKCAHIYELFLSKEDLLERVFLKPLNEIMYKPRLKNEGFIGFKLYDSRSST